MGCACRLGSMTGGVSRVMHEFDEGGVRLSLEGPGSPDDLVRAEEARGDAGAGYWAHLWSASRALAGYVARGSMVGPGVRVLEIGCGLGLSGFVAAARGAEVTLTDYHEDALAVARENAARLGLGVRVARLDWREDRPARGCADVILGADVVYDESAHEWIARLIARVGCVALIADPDRRRADGFADALDRAGVGAWVTRLDGGGSSVRLFVCQSRGVVADS